MGDNDDIKEEFKRRAQEHMSGPNPHKPTHTIYWIRERGDEAKAAWQRANKLLDVQLNKAKAPDAYLFEQLGNVHHKLGQADKARDAWQRSYEITPNESLRKKLNPTKKEG